MTNNQMINNQMTNNQMQFDIEGIRSGGLVKDFYKRRIIKKKATLRNDCGPI